MADKKITLSIGGQEVVCNFGVNYYYLFFNEITGIDMLVEGLKGIGTTQMFKIIPAIYCAGYMAECRLKKEDPKFTKDDFEHHVLSMDEAGAEKMAIDYSKAINPPKPGEATAQTESP
jgi:aldehyde:ferredoxin oxidoreductase